MDNCIIEFSKKNMNLAVIGKNSVGKTFFLNTIRQYLDIVVNNHVNALDSWLLEYEDLINKKLRLEKQLKIAESRSTINLINMQYKITTVSLQELDSKIKLYRAHEIYCKFNNPELVYKLFSRYHMLISYFTENRSFSQDLEQENKSYQNFIHYITEIKKQSLKSSNIDDSRQVAILAKQQMWLQSVEDCLNDIVNDYNLQLQWHDNQFTLFNTKNNMQMSLLELSKGHRAILAIISILIDQARLINLSVHSLKGIVLIDEVELHLDLNLQEKILPCLFKIFSNIQFIVTTHNCTVLKNINNFQKIELV